ncbi:DMT family transporter [Stieleria sp. JC731]|uniref:DMT family transporter n=1 Tax=Pirellulaceae TaxID=2691357 RepID=UPI001E3AE3BF|nr:EamA family transporter [Stieleria sp. JC731]MCC9599557.1 DMT family transporter [Stieleria sp. JC731]
MSKHSALIGPICGLASAILYTLTNIALRHCVEVDPYLVSAVKAAPTVVILGPYLLLQLKLADHDNTAHSNLNSDADSSRTNHSTRNRLPPRHHLRRFIGASFLAQFFGNAAFQKALGYIGLAASVPITLGVLIVGGAILGVIILSEPVSRRKVVAMATLIFAVVILSLPDSFAPSNSQSVSAADILTGSLWAAISGLAYSFFGVTMRMTLQQGFPSSLLMFLSGVTGTVTLWGYCFIAVGFSVVSQTTPTQWLAMTAAGIFNFTAFVAITASLRLLPVVAVNLINASQVAMAAIAGVILFGEPMSIRLLTGIALTFIGLVILARRTRATVVVTD